MHCTFQPKFPFLNSARRERERERNVYTKRNILSVISQLAMLLQPYMAHHVSPLSHTMDYE